MTMRNRLALAICEHAITGCCWRKTGENVEISKKCASCQSAVSFVLKAMREPTDAMLLQAKEHMDSFSSNLSWWQAMIDAALRGED